MIYLGPEPRPLIRPHGCEFCGKLPAFYHLGKLVCLKHANHVK